MRAWRAWVGGPALPMASILAAAAVLSSTAPMTVLFLDAPWWPIATVQVMVVLVIGIGLRSVDTPPVRTAVVQLVGILIVQSYAFPAANPVLGGLIPSPSTWSQWQHLAADAARTIAANAAPAPSSSGIAFVVSVSIALLALSVDVVAVGSRMPAMAALPLLTPFLTAAANSPGSLPPFHVALTLTLWAAMMLEQDQDWLAAWRPDLARSRRLPPQLRRTVWGSTLAVTAILMGLTAGAFVPHLPQRYLAEGLGRGNLGAPHRVGFSPHSDMVQDLRSGDSAPVLTYTTDDPTTPPLRVSVATTYADGKWTPTPSAVGPSRQPQLPYPNGLQEDTVRTEAHIKVLHTGLAAPYLASPVPIIAGTVVGAHWAVDSATGMPVVDQTPHSYDLSYLVLAPTLNQLQSAGAASRVAKETLVVPPEANTELLRRSAKDAVGRVSTAYQKAVAIQDWLRGRGDFTYSLELTPPPRGMDAATAGRTALDRFLQSRRGYCVQFATAMVMMARAEGIPARMATGFLPGHQEGTTRVVTAADAHAWPELYFEGAGWLRFEPTPGERSGSAPVYTDNVSAPSPSTSTAAPSARPTPSTAHSSSRPAEEPHAPSSAPAPEENRPFGAAPWIAVAVLIVLVATVPTTAALVRARRRRRAVTTEEAIEAEWVILAEGLKDLGLEVPAAATPRGLHEHLAASAVAERHATLALERVLLALEDVRYAPEADQDVSARHVERIRIDARRALRGVAAAQPWRQRLRARMLPSAGLTALRLPTPRRPWRTSRR
ncbi:hypothetical protein KEM60_00602 [Austwickia sp. TVS 96-490-7B]|uniref:transglutaminaseTgpA domain-containing protein n=1 Tax=Austwickia sp. TVS 96-490-7B TaxID=2830843 RepID=UPI001C5992FD|nr:transglutaminaseTgpA domain-containing protein [Austwickia sp. TVS 96-490-7B]MBW3084415.1 hypothetical protein [Austwickia sp. TVS 96-490-7B]